MAKTKVNLDHSWHWFDKILTNKFDQIESSCAYDSYKHNLFGKLTLVAIGHEIKELQE